MDKITELLTRGVANIIPNQDTLRTVLKSGKKLNIYLGIDPTSTRIHLGHAVPLRKLHSFAEAGHNVTFLIGDFTALVGDTSDKESERPILTKEEIEQNFQTYKKQAEKIIDFSKIKVRFNSEWLSTLTFADLIKLSYNFSFGDFANRELIRNRLQQGKHVGFHEGLYPVMQGYDSYYLDTDLQLGGTDQTFNMQAGRLLQKNLRSKESFIMTNIFLTGTDGRKMSKSWGNAIWLEDSPEDMFAKAMAVDDPLIIEYYTLGTNVPLDEIKAIEQQLQKGQNPMEIKKKLAQTIVTELHSEDDAQRAQEHFERTVQHKELPTEIDDVKISTNEPLKLEDLLFQAGLAASKSEAKRVIQQGGVEIDGKKHTDSNLEIPLHSGMIVKVGKRRVVKISN